MKTRHFECRYVGSIPASSFERFVWDFFGRSFAKEFYGAVRKLAKRRSSNLREFVGSTPTCVTVCFCEMLGRWEPALRERFFHSYTQRVVSLKLGCKPSAQKY